MPLIRDSLYFFFHSGGFFFFFLALWCNIIRKEGKEQGGVEF